MELSFRPIDVETGLQDALRFRRASCDCNVGDQAHLDEAAYVDWLKATSAQDPELAVHAFLDGALIGQLELGVSRTAPWVGEIHLCYLRPEYRGRILAHLLDAHAAAVLQKHGHASARLAVSTLNQRALRFYTSTGWSFHGSFDGASDVQLLEKRLVPAYLNVPTLTTERLFLRDLSELDIPSYERHFVDYEVIRHLARRVPWPYPAGGVAAHFRALAASRLPSSPARGTTGLEDRWVWGIFRKEAPLECIGCVGLFRPGRPYHRGFWLGRPFWGQGFMTEAASAVNDHAFDVLGFEELTFANARGNQRSRRVKEKTAARFVGVAPAEYVDPTLHEQELWQLSKQAWRALRAAQHP